MLADFSVKRILVSYLQRRFTLTLMAIGHPKAAGQAVLDASQPMLDCLFCSIAP
jgi:hypothetical protein